MLRPDLARASDVDELPARLRACDARSTATGRPCSAVATHVAAVEDGRVYACREHAAPDLLWQALDGRAVTALPTLPTPAEIARVAYPSPHEAFDAARIAATEGASLAYAAVCAALEAEAERQEDAAGRWRDRGCERARADCLVRVNALRAFADRLLGGEA